MEKYLWGGLLAGIALGLQIFVIHLQITYYTLIIVLIYGLFELIYAVREQRLKQFGTAMGVLLLAVMLARRKQPLKPADHCRIRQVFDPRKIGPEHRS
jgi:uncharacterized membrane protein SirB2